MIHRIETWPQQYDLGFQGVKTSWGLDPNYRILDLCKLIRTIKNQKALRMVDTYHQNKGGFVR